MFKNELREQIQNLITAIVNLNIVYKWLEDNKDNHTYKKEVVNLQEALIELYKGTEELNTVLEKINGRLNKND